MLKASDLVNFSLSMVGMPYWYGTCVYICTSSLLSRKAKQYPSHYGNSRMSTYKKHIAERKVCMDCIGMIKGFFWTNGGKGVLEYLNGGAEFSSKYGSNNCPDKGANGMLSWLKSKGCQHGAIATLPEVPGVLLFKPGHVGVYVGGGYAVEAQGFAYGVVKTKVSKRPWTEWAYMPASALEYDTEKEYVIPAETQTEDTSNKSQNAESASTTPSVDMPTKFYQLGSRTIRFGVKGNDVVELQQKLVKLGYNLGTYGTEKNGIDGNCGSKTVKAIKDFQTSHGLTVDGKYGAKTHAAMLKAFEGNSETSTAGEFTIKVQSWSVNVRNAPSTSTGQVVRVVRMNTLLSAVGIDSATGWYKLSDGNYICNEYVCKV